MDHCRAGDAPNTSRADALDRLAFVGKGAVWSVTVRAPRTSEERARCSSPILNHKYEDESGTGEIPRFVHAPGAENEKIPAVQSLPCFILPKGRLKQIGIQPDRKPENPGQTEKGEQPERLSEIDTTKTGCASLRSCKRIFLMLVYGFWDIA